MMRCFKEREAGSAKLERSKKMGRYVALLRGINVGGRNKLPMDKLISMFNDAGCKDVQTFIQSGNVIFNAEMALMKRIPFLIKESIFDSFGFEVPVITRTGDEFAKIVDANPFQGMNVDARTLHVAFLSDRPDATKVATLDPDRSPPDEFVVHGREIYLHCPNGLARTKLTNEYFDSRLSTISTLRNWRTTLKILELALG
jgi:uncharacterized protein (DUF1697 family)